MNPNRGMARNWHIIDTALHLVLLTFASVGLVGHFWLARREDKWTLTKPWSGE